MEGFSARTRILSGVLVLAAPFIFCWFSAAGDPRSRSFRGKRHDKERRWARGGISEIAARNPRPVIHTCYPCWHEFSLDPLPGVALVAKRHRGLLVPLHRIYGHYCCGSGDKAPIVVSNLHEDLSSFPGYVVHHACSWAECWILGC